MNDVLTRRLLFGSLSIGIYSSLTVKLGAVKIYVIGIFVSLVICLVLLGLELNLLNGFVNSICEAKKFGAYNCASYRHFRWILAVVCFVISMPACCSCMFCAYSFQIALQPPRSMTPVLFHFAPLLFPLPLQISPSQTASYLLFQTVLTPRYFVSRPRI